MAFAGLKKEADRQNIIAYLEFLQGSCFTALYIDISESLMRSRREFRKWPP